MDKRVFDYIREHLHKRANLSPPPKLPSLAHLKKISWNQKFEQLMRNRLIIGSFRYETFDQKKLTGDRYDYAKYIRTKLSYYEDSGNTEALVDIANLALLEFSFGSHPKKHFYALDDTPTHAEFKK